jgi:hypothetical protein
MEDMSGVAAETSRKPVLDPVARVSEMLFGLFMALTFVGAISVATAGREEIRTMFFAALGCNLAWGLVDAVVYLVETITTRGRLLMLVRAVRAAADVTAGRRIVAGSLPDAVAGVVSAAEVEAIHGRLMAVRSVPDRPQLLRDDLLAALGIFLICVVATFPVVLPFAFINDVAIAKTLSRGLALAMLFAGGLALGRYAGYGSVKAGLMMAALGSILVAAIMALGG